MLQPNKPEYSARFRHSSLLGWVCLFAAGGGEGEGYVRVLKFQPLCVCIPLVSKQTETYLMGICSQFVFCLLSP